MLGPEVPLWQRDRADGAGRRALATLVLARVAALTAGAATVAVGARLPLLAFLVALGFAAIFGLALANAERSEPLRALLAGFVACEAVCWAYLVPRVSPDAVWRFLAS